MKSVLISIQPQWCEKIVNGEKTVEVRKTKPKIKPPFKCYIYCTSSKGKHFLNRHNGRVYIETKDILGGRGYGTYQRLNGKVIGEFVCNEIECIDEHEVFNANALEKYACMSIRNICEYSKWKTFYCWHISELKIYAKPKELSEFKIVDKENLALCRYRFRAGQPQSKLNNGGYLKGSWLCMENNEAEFCGGECFLKPLTRPPQSWCYVEEVTG